MNLLISVFWTLFLCPCGGGSFRSGVQPPTGIRMTGIPRLERSTHAKAGEGRMENKNQSKDLFREDAFPDLGLRECLAGVELSDLEPVGG